MAIAAPATNTVFHALADQLEPLAPRGIFGVMGEDTAALITDLCLRGVPFYRARHENHGVGMADGYAWASGELAVATVTRGPGLMNAATAARTASQGGRKVLIISGDVATHMDVVDDYKYVDHGPIAAALGLEYVRVTRPEDASSGLARAVESASSGRTTLLSIAVDVLHAPLGSEAPGAAPPAAAPAAPVEPSGADIAAIAEILSRSERPLLLAGQGAATAMARSALEALAERAGAWLGTTLPAKGLFSGSPYDVGVVGGFSSDPVAPLLADIDCVVALGASLHMHTTGTRTLFGDATVIQVDTDPEALGRRFPAQLAVLGDAEITARRLLAELPDTGGGARQLHAPALLQRLREPLYAGPDESTGDRLDPRAVVRALDELLPAERSVVLDSGRFMTSPGRFLRAHAPFTVRHTAEGGSIGLGLGIALGATVARPELTNLLFVGDGGLSMSVTELETAVRHSLPLAIIAMNDSAYGSEVVHLEADGLPTEFATFPEYNFAALARGVGMEAEEVRTMDDLRAAAPRLSGRTSPILLDVKIRQDLTATRLRWPLEPALEGSS